MRKIQTLLMSAMLLLFASIHAFASTPCTPSFPAEVGHQFGWQGGDAVYSIPLPDGRVVWIFGDTLYGRKRTVVGLHPNMVRNSVGVSACKNGAWHLDYTIRRDARGVPMSFFQPQAAGHWYWAMDGFYANGSVWVTLLCMRQPKNSTPSAFDFEGCGTDLAEIDNPTATPQEWKVKIHPLVPDGAKAYPAATTVVDGNYAYLFATAESGTHPLLVTRIPLDGLATPRQHLEYLARNNEWKPGFVPQDAKAVMDSASSEMSIRYHADRKQWIAVMMSPQFLSNKMVVRTASGLLGPWSAMQTLYTVPEMGSTPEHDKNVFCYAAKEHPEFTTQGKLLVTYVCNTTVIPDLATKPQIYMPQVRSLPLPPAL